MEPRLDENEPAGRMLAIIPILGLNQRLGTAVAESRPSAFPLQ